MRINLKNEISYFIVFEEKNLITVGYHKDLCFVYLNDKEQKKKEEGGGSVCCTIQFGGDKWYIEDGCVLKMNGVV